MKPPILHSGLDTNIAWDYCLEQISLDPRREAVAGLLLTLAMDSEAQRAYPRSTILVARMAMRLMGKDWHDEFLHKLAKGKF